jgi:hypothetical protein
MVDVHRELVAQFGSNLVIGFAIVTVSGGESFQVAFFRLRSAPYLAATDYYWIALT